MLQSLNGSVNSIWVGRGLGEAALTATSNANTVMFLLIGAAFGVALAATILIGQSIGANNLAETKRVVGTSATFFAAISVAMAIAGLLLCRPLLIAMSTPPDSLELAVAYMRVIFLAVPFLYLYAFVMAVLRGAGDSKTPFYFMLLSVGIDIALNPVFIFGLGPVPRLGIAGSALATFIAQAVSLTALIRHLYRRHHVLCLHREELAAPQDRLGGGGDTGEEGHPDERADAGDVLKRRAHDHAGQPLRRRHHRGVRRRAADLELHPDAGVRRRHGAVGHDGAERRRRASGTA